MKDASKMQRTWIESTGDAKEIDLNDWRKLAVNLGLANNKKEKRIKELEDAMQEFVERCERGEVRSKYTYNKFKQLLNDK